MFASMSLRYVIDSHSYKAIVQLGLGSSKERTSICIRNDEFLSQSRF